MDYNRELSKVSVHTYEIRNTKKENVAAMNIVIDPE
jgi:hypothetical protein